MINEKHALSLGRRAKACKRVFKYVRGLVDIRGWVIVKASDSDVFVYPGDDDPSHEDLASRFVPDLRDPGTLGHVQAMVREVFPLAKVSPINVQEGGLRWRSFPIQSHLMSDEHYTEAEAWLVMLERANAEKP